MQLNTDSPGQPLVAQPYSGSSDLTACTLTYLWSVTEWDNSSNIFRGININGLDNTSSPTSLTVGDLNGSIALGTYEFKLTVIDSA